MMTIFRFVDYVHKRKHSPAQATHYSEYRSLLRNEFEKRCAYCSRCDYFELNKEVGNINFQIDHYRPKEKFPKLICQYNNLFYSCVCCNGCKKDYWPETDDLPKILNPCEDILGSHLMYDQNLNAVALTNLGIFFINRLKLNSPKNLEVRVNINREIEFMAKINNDFKTMQSKLNKINREIKKKIKKENYICNQEDKESIETLKKVSREYNDFKNKLINRYDQELLNYL